ncbi:PAS domain S-box protein [Chloracidobacterium aggregatum]|uniref:hybrid sensor histidine kinase/response regulator n=1 Tax=Chloracidobacterium aggregatum TaxID=2851959 RepID=UPI001B8AFBA6|nr:PAS domain S-box protein [Chloracidobacterium aggregatum]QUV84503.1 PAS domain S-box protein [Chloracidobacterium sp. 2]QUV87000.1 PAS domain S-box protein [Chloracidobacterium sp. S]
MVSACATSNPALYPVVEATSAPNGTPVVLVVDDDFQLCEFLSDLLESDGFEVLKAWNGEEALRLVETITPDLVLLDIHMPHLDGIQTCAELRKRPKTAHTPILMLTAVIEEESIEQAFVAGATDYMTKPPSPLALRFRAAGLINAHRRNRQLRETETRLQSVIRHASDAILTLDQTLTVVSANPSAAHLFAAATEHLIGRSIGELLAIAPENLGALPVETESCFPGAPGRMVEVTAGEFHSGSRRFYTLIVRDITERKKAENQLREWQVMLQSTLDTLSAHIAVLDQNGVILEVNEAWKRFARENGLQTGNFGIGMNYLALCEQATGPESEVAHALARGIRQVMAGKAAYTLEYPRHSPWARRWFIARVARLADLPEAPIVVAHEESTEQHLAREQLQQANQFMRRVIEAIPDGIGVLDAHGRLKLANRALSHILGVPASELLRQRVSGFLTRHRRPALREAVRRLLHQGGGVEDIETSVRRKDGCFVPVRLSLVPVMSDQTLVVIVEDLTPQKAMVEVLRRRDEEWSATVDAISDLILLEDSQGRLRRCNRAVTTFLGATYQRLIGQPTVRYFFPHLSATAKTLREAVGDQPEFQFPGRDQWFEMSSYWIPQERGIGTGWVHVIKDITARRQADSAMRRLTAAIEQIAEAVVMLDGSGYVQYVNPAFEKTTGLVRESAYGCQFFELPVGPVQASLRDEIFRALQSGREWHGIYTARRKDGTTYQEEASVSPVWDEAGRLQNIVAVCRDVTEQLRYESIAEAVNVMETTGYIFSGIRHEMGNPINSVKTALTVLKQMENPSRATIAKYLDRSLAEISRVEYLLKTLRSFSLYETPVLEPLPVAPFLERFCSLIEEDFAKRGIRLEYRFEKDAGTVRADQRALHQALLNLVTNAADALEGCDDPTITLRVFRREHLVSIVIADNGVGLTPQQLDQLFKPFYTSKPHGTGLGLVITRKLITKMNGTVELRPGPTGGCEAIVTLEAVAPKE